MPEKTIEFKWKEGYKNLNIHFKMFDHILLIDNSSEIEPVQNICTLSKGNNDDYEFHLFQDLPEYAERRFPDIYAILTGR